MDVIRNFKISVLVLLDIILINLSIVIGLFLRFSLDEHYLQIPVYYMTRYYNTAVVITAIFIVIFYIFRLYSSLWRYASVNEIVSIFFATVIATILSYIYGITFNVYLPRSIYIISWMLIMLSVGGIRFSNRIFWMAYFYNKKERSAFKNILIVGAGASGAKVVKEMQKNKELGYYPVGIIDDDKYKQGKYINNVQVLGNRNDIEKIVKQKWVDEIIIAMPSASQSEIKGIIDICKNVKCKVRIQPGVNYLLDTDSPLGSIRDIDIEDLLGRAPVMLDIDNIADYLNNKTVLVTGGGGSIGSELCRQIAKFSPDTLLVLDIYENNVYDLQNELDKLNVGFKIKVLIGSVRDKQRVDEIFSTYRPDVVFHAAAHKHVPLMEDNPLEAVKNNIYGTLNMVECAHKYGTKRFVMISTDKAVNPTNVMGATKRVCEMIIQAIDQISNTEFVAVRFGNVLGSNGSVIPLFKKQIQSGGPITVTHPEINRFFMTIPEAAQLVIQAGAMAKGGEIFVLDMGQPVKIVDLARDLIKLSGLEPEKDIKIVFTGLRPGEKLYEEVLMAEEGLNKTAHEKIMVGTLSNIDYYALLSKLEDFETIINKNPKEVKQALMDIVPTYHTIES
ncbi:UDP-N-acetyl-alpha-D-glucosamine C6 dehydratase [Oxobacter pfennigii]|uniref:UDP-N-acetyl-alpha-D-glucosamine C6 dehydratase n=1 Tax=Oxobacter pfennigii TaxID=36849 RepID=A0A0P8X3K3_9CLOT|nr:nucleoside-diphosphate sugar epimerase/dehydratase [Oxobacter pfennigii]KPU45371.1 UDP-N-acetyl-alpha-D-glucosamine C6 dehydratase [Oxobacter pfennigii]